MSEIIETEETAVSNTNSSLPNQADYFTKPYSVKQTKEIRPFLVHDPSVHDQPLFIDSKSYL